MCANVSEMNIEKKSPELVTQEQKERVETSEYSVLKQDARTYYDMSRRLSDKQHNYLRNNVREAILDNLGQSRYQAIDDLKIKKAGQEPKGNVALHHSLGSKYALNGEDVVEFNVSNSGNKYVRMEHKGITGDKKTEDYREKDIKVSWYNKIKPFTWLPKVKTKKQIEEINANRVANNQKLDDVYGKRVTDEVAGKKLGHLRKKESVNDKKATKTRYYLKGPNISDTGKYSEAHLEEYIFELGKSSLENKLNRLERLDNSQVDKAKPLHVMLQGQGRGGIAVALGAMRLKRWIADNHPRLLNKVYFDLIQYDPVMGDLENKGKNKEIDHDPGDEKLAKKDPRYMSLGAEAETTVVYSMHADHKRSQPQKVNHPRRIILTTSDQGMNMGQVDTSQEKATRATYLAEKEGKVEAFRSSGLSELDDGVYICDDQNNLIKIKSLEEFDAIAAPLLKGAKLQWDRHDVVRSMVKSWFAGNGEQAAEKELEKDQKQSLEKKEEKSAKPALKTSEEFRENYVQHPKEMEGAIQQLAKLEVMPQNTEKQKAAYQKRNKKYIKAKRSGLKAYVNRLHKQDGGYIDSERQEYLNWIVDLSYYKEKEAAGSKDAKIQQKIDKLVDKIKISPLYYNSNSFMPGYLKNNLFIADEKDIAKIVYPPIEDEKSLKELLREESAEKEEVREEKKDAAEAKVVEEKAVEVKAEEEKAAEEQTIEAKAEEEKAAVEEEATEVKAAEEKAMEEVTDKVNGAEEVKNKEEKVKAKEEAAEVKAAEEVKEAVENKEANAAVEAAAEVKEEKQEEPRVLSPIEKSRIEFLKNVITSNSMNPFDTKVVIDENDPDVCFKKYFKDAYLSNLNDQIRYSVEKNLKEAGGKAPDAETVKANMPKELNAPDGESKEFLEKYIKMLESGADTKTLNHFRSEFNEDLKKQNRMIDPHLNAVLIAMADSVDTARIEADARPALMADAEEFRQDPKYRVYKDNLKDEKQEHALSCWACSGTMMANAYRLNNGLIPPGENEEQQPYFSQEDFLDQKNLLLSQQAKDSALGGEAELNTVREEISIAKEMVSGNEMGNPFQMADVFLRKLPDTAVKNMIFSMKNNDPMLKDLQAVEALKLSFMKKLQEALDDANGPVSMLIQGKAKHFVTVIGIENGVIKYRDSLSTNKKDPADPDKEASIDQTWDMSSDEFFDLIRTSPVQITHLVHLTKDSIGKIQNDYGIGDEEHPVYDENGKLNAASGFKMDMERIFHNLGERFEKPGNVGGPLEKMDLVSEQIYLPKNRDCLKNVADNLPAQDLLEDVTQADLRSTLEKQEEKTAEKTKQKDEKQEEAKKEEKGAAKWDNTIKDLFAELCGSIQEEHYDRKQGKIVGDEIWSRIRVMDNEDSPTYRQFRSAVNKVLNLVKKFGPHSDEERQPSADALMQAMARLSETANAYYDTHRGHMWTEKGADRRKACDLVRGITRDFYDKLDVAMGGSGLGSLVTKKNPENRTKKERDISAYKMDELVDVYKKWKKHFALQEGLERTRVRNRGNLFEPYMRFIDMYKDTHEVSSWSKEIREIIRDANFYRVQNRVHETFEEEKGGMKDPLLDLAKKHVNEINGKTDVELDAKKTDKNLSKAQLNALDLIDEWFLRNYNNGGIVGSKINVRNHHGETVESLFSKTKRERLFIYYLIETGQRKNPCAFDLFASQAYIPNLDNFKGKMLASKFKIMSRIMGTYTYMGKVTDALQVNNDYNKLLKDCTEVDKGVKEVKGKELEELKKNNEAYRTYALLRTAKSTKAFREEAVRVNELGDKATEKDKKSLENLQQAFLKDLQELISADDKVGEDIKYGDGLGKVTEDAEGKLNLEKNDKYYSVKNTNRQDLADNTNTYMSAVAGISKNVHMPVNAAILYGSAVDHGLDVAKGKAGANLTFWKLSEYKEKFMQPGTYASTITSTTISCLNSLLGACYGVYNLTANWSNMHGGDRAAEIGGIITSAANMTYTALNTLDTAKDLADQTTPVASTLTKGLGFAVAGLKTVKDAYTTLTGHLDVKNARKASKKLNDKIYKRYAATLNVDHEPETEEQKAQKLKEYKQARFERNMLRLVKKISKRKRKFAAAQMVGNVATTVGLVVPPVSYLGTVVGGASGLLSGMELTKIRTDMFDQYFQFDEFMKDALEVMSRRGQKVNNTDEFKERMRRVLAATAGYADVVSACDQIGKKYADQICRGLFGDAGERVEGEMREGYIEIVKGFGLPYDEKKKIPSPDLLARRMNGK